MEIDSFDSLKSQQNIKALSIKNIRGIKIGNQVDFFAEILENNCKACFAIFCLFKFIV